MQISDPNPHLKLQEMCDCYLETDFRLQLAKLCKQPGPDQDEEAIRYLALALMHTITEQARKLSMKREKLEVKVKVESDGEKHSLPAPPVALFNRMVATVRAILHLEGEKGESQLSLGLRNGEVAMRVKIRENGDEVALRFELS
jgi:hypothetical protein